DERVAILSGEGVRGPLHQLDAVVVLAQHGSWILLRHRLSGGGVRRGRAGGQTQAHQGGCHSGQGRPDDGTRIEQRHVSSPLADSPRIRGAWNSGKADGGSTLLGWRRPGPPGTVGYRG